MERELWQRSGSGGSGGKQQRVAGEEETDEEAGFGEDDGGDAEEPKRRRDGLVTSSWCGLLISEGELVASGGRIGAHRRISMLTPCTMNPESTLKRDLTTLTARLPLSVTVSARQGSPATWMMVGIA